MVDCAVVDASPVLPIYNGANLRGIMPALLGPAGTDGLPDWFPAPVRGARQVVVLLVDGLGWRQLQDRLLIAPTLAAMAGGPITTVAPSTTATALTSVTTGLTPAEHGLIGYRVDFAGEVLNVLRWSTPSGDARTKLPPQDIQPFPAFLGQTVPVIARAGLEGTGFSAAHLAGAKPAGWRTMSNIPVEIAARFAAGEPVVYAYYDGIDTTAHERGFGEYYDAELVAVDRMIGDVLARLTPDQALVVTADHGQVEVGPRVISPDPAVLQGTRSQSGEGRFRWLHARPGAAADVAAAARAAHGDVAWVVTREQILDEAWFGSPISTPVVRRLGDVALVAREPVSFHDPADSGPFPLVCRHGSLTAEEMYIPLIAARGR